MCVVCLWLCVCVRHSLAHRSAMSGSTRSQTKSGSKTLQQTEISFVKRKNHRIPENLEKDLLDLKLQSPGNVHFNNKEDEEKVARLQSDVRTFHHQPTPPPALSHHHHDPHVDNHHLLPQEQKPQRKRPPLQLKFAKKDGVYIRKLDDSFLTSPTRPLTRSVCKETIQLGDTPSPNVAAQVEKPDIRPSKRSSVVKSGKALFGLETTPKKETLQPFEVDNRALESQDEVVAKVEEPTKGIAFNEETKPLISSSVSNSPIVSGLTPSRKSVRNKKPVALFQTESFRTPSKRSLLFDERSNSPAARETRSAYSTPSKALPPLQELRLTSTGLQTRRKRSQTLPDDSTVDSPCVTPKGRKSRTTTNTPVTESATSAKFDLASVVKSATKITPTKRKSSQENVDISPNKITKFFSPKQNGNQLNLYQKFKLALSINNNDKLIFRERETIEVQRFLTENLRNKRSDSLYVYGKCVSAWLIDWQTIRFVDDKLDLVCSFSSFTGPPGTGKTATIKSILNNLEEEFSFRVISLNGMSFTSEGAFYQKMLQELGHKKSVLQRDQVYTIEKLICNRKKMLILLLDEVDALQSKSSKNQNLLLTVFGWSRLIDSNLIIVGISNTFDFTINQLARIHSLKLEPVKEVAFNPYVKDEILGILKDRIQPLRAAGENVIDDSALEICARKVSNSGDVRKALDIMRRSIELVEQEMCEKTNQPCPLKSRIENQEQTTIVANGFTVADGIENLIVESTPSVPLAMVKVPHVIKILNQVFGNKTVQMEDDEHNFPLQQQLILCVCLLLMHQQSKEVEVGKCYDRFVRICNQKGLSFDIGNTSDFVSMCYLLETKGFVSLRVAKEIRAMKLSLSVAEDEVRDMLLNKPLFISILGSRV